LHPALADPRRYPGHWHIRELSPGTTQTKVRFSTLAVTNYSFALRLLCARFGSAGSSVSQPMLWSSQIFGLCGDGGRDG
jgi:hypothetical protein